MTNCTTHVKQSENNNNNNTLFPRKKAHTSYKPMCL